MPTSPVPSLLQRLTADPGRPRLTWYGAQDERVELSGHVLDNWVTKTANLLVEEYEAGPGTRVLVDLPAHWRAVVWVLAAWRTGAHVVLDGTLAVDVVVSDRPERHVPAPEGSAGRAVVGVALPALARALPQAVPGVDDATAAVMTYGDVLTWMPEADAASPALTVAGTTYDHAGLSAWWSGALPGGADARPRVLVEAADDDAPRALAAVVAALDADGSAVLCGPEPSARHAAEPERRARLVETERVTRTV